MVLIRQCKPHQLRYLRERGLKEEKGFFLADGSGVVKWGCAIYETRPATCRDFCGKTLSSGKRYFVPTCCTMAGGGGEA